MTGEAIADDKKPVGPAGVRERIRRIVRSNIVLYGLIGGFCASLDFVVYSVLVLLAGMNIRVANVISILVGIAMSFFLNARFNFKISDNMARRFMTFLAVGLAGLILSDQLIKVFSLYFNIGPILAKIYTLVFVFIFQFTLNKYISFTAGKRK